LTLYYWNGIWYYGEDALDKILKYTFILLEIAKYLIDFVYSIIE